MPRPTPSKFATTPLNHSSKGAIGAKPPKAGKPTRRALVTVGSK